MSNDEPPDALHEQHGLIVVRLQQDQPHRRPQARYLGASDGSTNGPAGTT